MGHHVARVVVPAAGTYSWEVSGSFAAQDLGSIVIGSDSGALPITSSGSATTSPLTWLTAGPSLALALLAVWDLLQGRRTDVPSPTSRRRDARASLLSMAALVAAVSVALEPGHDRLGR